MKKNREYMFKLFSVMDKNKHYFDKFPDVEVKIHTVAESLRKHLYIFKTITGVFSYRKIDLGTKILIENMIISNEFSVLLDLGCGYGPIGIVLGYESPDSLVYLIDINNRAIWCAKENIKINLKNKIKKMHALQGNYFEPIQNKNIKFDGIYMNPPLRQGRTEFLELFEIIPEYLKPQGSFQFVIKKKMGASYILDYITKKYPNNDIEIICKRSGYWVFRYFQMT